MSRPHIERQGGMTTATERLRGEEEEGGGYYSGREPQAKRTPAPRAAFREWYFLEGHIGSARHFGPWGRNPSDLQKKFLAAREKKVPAAFSPAAAGRRQATLIGRLTMTPNCVRGWIRWLRWKRIPRSSATTGDPSISRALVDGWRPSASRGITSTSPILLRHRQTQASSSRNTGMSNYTATWRPEHPIPTSP